MNHEFKLMLRCRNNSEDYWELEAEKLYYNARLIEDPDDVREDLGVGTPETRDPYFFLNCQSWSNSDDYMFIGPVKVFNKYSVGSLVEVKFTREDVEEFERNGGLTLAVMHVTFTHEVKELIDEMGLQKARIFLNKITNEIVAEQVMES